MDDQKPTEAPERFIRLIRRRMGEQRFTLRQFAKQVDVSPAYLSRLLNRERGVPADETIQKFEEVLDVQPRGSLFDAAGRHDAIAARVLKKDNARLLMRTLAPLSDEELAQVLKVAQRLAQKRTEESH